MKILRFFVRCGSLILAALFGLTGLLAVMIGRASFPTWEIAYSSRSRVANQRAVLLMDVERRLSLTLARGNFLRDTYLPFAPVLSPNRRFVVWISEYDGKLRLYNLRDETVHDLGAQLDFYNPSWSPDSRYLAYPRMGNIRVIAIDEDGSFSPSRILLEAEGSVEVVQFGGWLPDGGGLSFAGVLNQSNDAHIYSAGLDGTVQRLIDTSAFMPAWSPDGTRLAYLDVSQGNRQQIVVQDLVQQRDFAFPLPRFFFIENFIWSPDGTKLASTAYNAAFEGLEVHVIDLETGEFSPVLVSLPQLAPYLVWSPDSDWLAFAAALEDGIELYTLNVTTLERRRLTHNNRVEVVLP